MQFCIVEFCPLLREGTNWTTTTYGLDVVRLDVGEARADKGGTGQGWYSGVELRWYCAHVPCD